MRKRPLLPPPVNETEATLRSFLMGNLGLTLVTVLLRQLIYLQAERLPGGYNPALLNIATMSFTIIFGMMCILMAGLIQHERAKHRRGKR